MTEGCQQALTEDVEGAALWFTIDKLPLNPQKKKKKNPCSLGSVRNLEAWEIPK